MEIKTDQEYQITLQRIGESVLAIEKTRRGLADAGTPPDGIEICVAPMLTFQRMMLEDAIHYNDTVLAVREKGTNETINSSDQRER